MAVSTPPPHLAAAVLAAAVRNRFGSEPEPIACGFTAAVDDGERIAILLPLRSEDDGADLRDFGLGSVLIWGRNHELPIVVVAAPEESSRLARQAQSFDQLSVHTIEGTTLVEAVPESLPSVPELGSAALDRAAVFESVGAIPVDDFGRLVAEVQGLEVARADGATGVLEIGVGEADRQLHGYVHTNRDRLESLQSAADTVRAIRQMGAAGHPLNRRARQRWLRSAAHSAPELLGSSSISLLPPLAERTAQLGPEACAALDDAAGVLYVFSAGIDPEVVPVATDYRRRHQAQRTVIVTSPADAFGATAQIASSVGIETITIPAPY